MKKKAHVDTDTLLSFKNEIDLLLSIAGNMDPLQKEFEAAQSDIKLAIESLMPLCEECEQAATVISRKIEVFRERYKACKNAYQDHKSSEPQPAKESIVENTYNSEGELIGTNSMTVETAAHENWRDELDALDQQVYDAKKKLDHATELKEALISQKKKLADDLELLRIANARTQSALQQINGGIGEIKKYSQIAQTKLAKASFVLNKYLLEGISGVVERGDSEKLSKAIRNQFAATFNYEMYYPADASEEEKQSIRQELERLLMDKSNWSKWEAQHLVPSEEGTHPVLQKIGMNLNHPSNGIMLPIPDKESSHILSTHTGYHRIYNNLAREKLDQMDLSQSVETLMFQVYELQQTLRLMLTGGVPIYKRQEAAMDDQLRTYKILSKRTMSNSAVMNRFYDHYNKILNEDPVFQSMKQKYMDH